MRGILEKQWQPSKTKQIKVGTVCMGETTIKAAAGERPAIAVFSQVQSIELSLARYCVLLDSNDMANNPSVWESSFCCIQT